MRWSRIFHRNYWDEERARELQGYLEIETAENIARGMPPKEAREAAHRKLGNPARIREEIFRMNSLGFLETLWQDVHYGARMLRKNPGFTAIAVLTLALGIGANSAIFSVVNAVLLRPLPYQDADRLAALQETSPRVGPVSVSYPNFLDWRQQSHAFSQMAAVHNLGFNLSGVTQPENIEGLAVSPNFLSLLGVRPFLGRDFLPEEETAGNGAGGSAQLPIVAIAHGRGPECDRAKHYARWPQFHDYWGPASHVSRSRKIGCDCADWSMGERHDRARRSRGYERDRPVGARRDVRTGASGDGDDRRTAGQGVSGGQSWRGSGHDVDARCIRGRYASGRSGSFCSSGAGIADRVRECGQSFPGARRCPREGNCSAAGVWRKPRPRSPADADGKFSAIADWEAHWESSGNLGRAAAWGHLIPPDSIPGMDVRMDQSVLLFTGAIVVLVARCLSGCSRLFRPPVPMCRKRSKKADAAQPPARDSNGCAARWRLRKPRWRLVLLVGAGLMMKSLYRLLQVNPGFRPARVLQMEMNLRSAQYSTPEAMKNFWQQVLDRARALPGVESVALGTNVPLSFDHRRSDLTIEGQPQPAPGEYAHPDFHIVSPGYTETLSVALLRGRSFTESDNESGMPVALINSALARRYWSNEDPIGKRILQGHRALGTNPWITIVGVVGDTKLYGLANPSRFEVYLPFRQRPQDDMNLLVRSAADPAGLTAAIRQSCCDDRQRSATLFNRDDATACRRFGCHPPPDFVSARFVQRPCADFWQPSESMASSPTA